MKRLKKIWYLAPDNGAWVPRVSEGAPPAGWVGPFSSYANAKESAGWVGDYYRPQLAAKGFQRA